MTPTVGPFHPTPRHRRHVRVGAGALLVGSVFLLGACTEGQRKDIADRATEEVGATVEAKACQVEAKVIEVSYKASAEARKRGVDEAVTDVITQSLLYFQLEDGPTTGPVQRSGRTLDNVPEAECPPIPVSAVPVGSR